MSIKKRPPLYMPASANAKGIVPATPGFKTRVKGSLKNETDINRIVARFQGANDGILPLTSPLTQSPVADASFMAMSLAERINFTRSAMQFFKSLPKALRDQVGDARTLAQLSDAQIRELISKSIPPAPSAPPSPLPAS